MAAGSYSLRTFTAVLAVIPGFDQQAFQQVTLNLIHTAVEAMERSERRELLIRTRRANGTVRVEVRDTGPGLSEKVRSSGAGNRSRQVRVCSQIRLWATSCRATQASGRSGVFCKPPWSTFNAAWAT